MSGEKPKLTELYVDLAEAARDFVATTSSFRQPHSSRPEFERLALALARLDAFPVDQRSRREA